MNDVRYVEIGIEDGQRLDNYLSRILKGVPKSHIYRIIRSGEIRVNKKRAKPAQKLQVGDVVRIPPIRLSEEKKYPHHPLMVKRLLEHIIYEDETLLVINKPAGIAVHGGSGVSLGVIEALRQGRTDLHYLELVHRLDKETSGCLLLAKKRSLLRSIQAAFEARVVKKTYWALWSYRWSGPKKIEVNAPLQKNILKSGERVVCVNLVTGKPSQTQFKLLENYAHACWIEALPKTGRTHQIRVHSAHLKHPIVGDKKYAQAIELPDIGIPQQHLYLHARAIQFELEGRSYSFQAELDAEFAEAIKALRMNGEVH